MRKKFVAFYSVLALLLCGIPLVNKEPAVEDTQSAKLVSM